MRRGQGERLPVPTPDEYASASAEGREIAACSGLKSGPLSVMKLACHNGDTATVCVDEYAALCLSEALKAFFPTLATAPASPAKVDRTEAGIEVQAGHMSA